jgi:hypothetical protein
LQKKRESEKKAGDKNATKHEEITSESAWWGVIRVCGLTIPVHPLFAMFCGAAGFLFAPRMKLP